MADNITLNPGASGAVLATDEISSVHYQVVKLAHGASDSATLISTSSGLPVDLRTNNLSGNLNVAVAAITAGVTIETFGDVAHDAAASAVNPLLVGAYASAVAPTDVSADTDSVRVWALRNGSMVVNVAAGGTLITGDGSNGLDVDVTRVQGTVTIAGAVTQATASNLNAEVQGDAAHDAAVSGNPLLTGAYASAAAPTDVSADGDAVRVWALRSGALATQVTAGGALVGGDVTNGLDVDVTRVSGTVTIAGAVTQATASNFNAEVQGDAAHDAAVSGNPLLLGAYASAAAPSDVSADGDAVRLWALRNGALVHNIAAGSTLITGDGSNGLDVDVTRVQGTVTISGSVAGDVAHDAADSGNPVKVGGVARQTNPTAVADGDRVNAYMDDVGKLVNYPFAPRDRTGHARISLTSATETELIAAGGAGIFRDLIQLILSNESSTEVRVDIADGASVGSTTDRISIDLAADGGGAVVPFAVPFKMGTANHLWSAQLSSGVSTVYITAVYVENN